MITFITSKITTTRKDIDYVTIAFPGHTYTATVSRKGQLTEFLATKKAYLIITLPSEVSTRIREEINDINMAGPDYTGL